MRQSFLSVSLLQEYVKAVACVNFSEIFFYHSMSVAWMG